MQEFKLSYNTTYIVHILTAIVRTFNQVYKHFFIAIGKAGSKIPVPLQRIFHTSTIVKLLTISNQEKRKD